MTMTSSTDVASIAPIDHAEGMALLAAELDCTVALLRGLDGDDWTARTDCPAWDVRQLYLHVLGACEGGASLWENARQMVGGLRHRRAHGGPLEAGLSAVQVQARERLSPAALVERLSTVAPRTVRGRTRMPGVIRRLRISVDGPVVERWSLGYLIDVIYLRDLWMHRIDAARATGRAIELSADHDGRIVADVVAEWSRRHGRPFTLALSGPAGGTFRSDGTAGPGGADVTGRAAETIEMDAVEFCRTLAGRAEGAGLLTTVVPF